MALSWLLYDEHREAADALFVAWAENDVEMIAPPMFRAEVISAIRKNVYFKRLLPVEGERLFSIYTELSVRIVDTPRMHRAAWDFAVQFNLPVCYDMQYLAVAELADCELWTADRRFVNALRGKHKRVKWLGE